MSTNAIAKSMKTSTQRVVLQRILLHKLFRLINLRSKVRTPASIGMVSYHESSVLFADHVFCKGSTSITQIPLV